MQSQRCRKHCTTEWTLGVPIAFIDAHRTFKFQISNQRRVAQDSALFAAAGYAHACGELSGRPTTDTAAVAASSSLSRPQDCGCQCCAAWTRQHHGATWVVVWGSWICHLELEGPVLGVNDAIGHQMSTSFVHCVWQQLASQERVQKSIQ